MELRQRTPPAISMPVLIRLVFIAPFFIKL